MGIAAPYGPLGMSRLGLRWLVAETAIVHRDRRKTLSNWITEGSPISNNKSTGADRDAFARRKSSKNVILIRKSAT